jgi:hypothetical protein
VFVDGQMRWVNADGTLGEPISGKTGYKMRQIGDEMLLLPIEESEGESNDDRATRIRKCVPL